MWNVECGMWNKIDKEVYKRPISKNMMPIFFLLGCLITFTISLLAYSSTYAVVTYGPTNTPPSLISTEGYYASIMRALCFQNQ